MAIKILTPAKKMSLSDSEFIDYQNKLVREVNRRSNRFKEDDKFFKDWKRQYSANNLSPADTFESTNTTAPLSDRRIAVKVLEDVIKSKRSTLKGRKEIADKAYETFKATHGDISRRDYNKFIKTMGMPAIQEGMQGMMNDYMLSEQIAEAYTEHNNNEDIIQAIIKIGENELISFTRKVSGDMILAVLRGADANEVLARVNNLSSQDDTNL